MQIRRRPPNPKVRVANLSFKANMADDQPNHILEEIVWHKETEIDRWRGKLTLAELQHQVQAVPPTKSFLAALQSGKSQPAVIAEVKKASPSKGVIRDDFDPVAIAQRYAANGASCISVLTDEKFFQGSFDYLAQIRQVTDIPLLCKEFILYPYQMYLARARGADAVLLIAAILSDKDLQYFIKIAKSLSLTPLVEVHTLEEFDRVLALNGIQLIGINNRNLEDFSVDLNTTCSLLDQRRDVVQSKGILIVSESGLNTPEDLSYVTRGGASAVLMGESLMRQSDPGAALAALISA